MKTTRALRVAIGAAGIFGATMTLSGCVGGPTYGTDKTAMAQLGDDLSNTVALGSSRDEQTKKLRYNPRPGLVVAGVDEDKGAPALPAPQTAMNNSANNPNWVESPEDTRARLRKEAEANEKNQNYRSPLLAGNGQAGTLTEEQKWQAFRQAKAKAETVDISQRTTLSDPPAEYRAADAAALNDLGEKESDKEKKRKKEAEEASKTSSWWKPFQ